MALKLLKISLNLEIKGDLNDPEDLRDRLYDYLEIAMENGDLDYIVDDDTDDLDLEE